MSQLGRVLTDLKKKHKDTIVDLSTKTSTVQKFFLDSPNMNYGFGGYFVDGRIYEFHGPESSGKTLLAMKIASEIQKRPEKNTIVFIDFEHTFDIAFYKKIFPKMRWDEKSFIYLDPLNGEEAFDILEELIKTNEIGLAIVDSVATMPTSAQLANEFGKSDFGAGARLMSAGLKKLNPYVSRFKTSIIFINQVRDAIDAYSAESIPGGRALPFYASSRFRISRIEDITEKGVVVGLRIKFANKKNKIGIPKRIVELDFKFESGFDVVREYASFILSLEIDFKASGAWVKHKTDENLKFNGKEKFIDWLRSEEERFSILKQTVDAMLCEKLESDNKTDEELEDQEFKEMSEAN